MHIDVRAKLTGAIFLLAAIASLLALSHARGARDRLEVANQAEQTRVASSAILHAAAALALERGATNILLAATAVTQDARAAAAASRRAAVDATDYAIKASQADGQPVAPVLESMAELQSARGLAWRSLDGSGARQAATWFSASTRAVESMLLLARQMAGALPRTAEARLAEGFALTSDLSETAEHLGRQRGLVAGILAGGRPFTPAQMQRLGQAEGARTLSVLAANVRATQLGQRYEAALRPVAEAIKMLQIPLAAILDASGAGSAYPISAPHWFDAVTNTIAAVGSARGAVEQQIKSDLDGDHADAVSALQLDLMVIAVCFSLTAGALWIVLYQVVRPLRALQGAVDRLAGSDFTVAIPHSLRQDELGAMARSIVVLKDNSVEAARLRADQHVQRDAAEARRCASLNEFAEKVEVQTRTTVEFLAGRTDAMQAEAGAMLDSAGRVSASSLSVTAAARNALINTQTVAAAAEQLSASIREITNQVGQSSEMAHVAAQRSNDTRVTIAELAATVDRVGAAATLIAGIAAQTNLLALNATIEAARAGDAGKGFAVVAAEVKSLAAQTGRVTEEVSRQITTIRQETRQAVAAVQVIVTTIGEIDQVASAIAAAVEEQGAATQEISRSIAHAAEATHEVTDRINDVANEAAATGKRAETLRSAATEIASAMIDLPHALVKVVRGSIPESNRRNEPRFDTNIPATLSSGGAARSVTLINLSESGARVSGADGLATGSSGELVISGLNAKVRFTLKHQEGSEASLQFESSSESKVRLAEYITRVARAVAA